MAADIDIFPTEGNVRVPLIGSVALHSVLFALALFGNLIPSGRGESWGSSAGSGGAISATLVSSIPLPTPPAETQNVLANESKGLAQSPPKEVPKRGTESDSDSRAGGQAQRVARVTQKKPPPREVAKVEENKIPFGQGGPVSGPYGSFSVAGTKGGLSFTGGSGDFGSRFGWYVDGVRRKVSENWMRVEIDPHIDSARRVYIYFELRGPASR